MVGEVSLSVTFEIGQTTVVVPGEQVDVLLEQLDRPRGGQAEAEATSVAAVIRKAIGRALANAVIEKRFALALLAATDDVQRAAGLVLRRSRFGRGFAPSQALGRTPPIRSFSIQAWVNPWPQSGRI